jgi:hypothetical protein
MNEKFFNTKKIASGNRALFLLTSLLLYGCAGTINTTKYPTQNTANFTKAYIVSTEDSQYIQFKFGVITPFGIIVPQDDAAEKHKIIGNTDSVIKDELAKYGITSEIGKKGDLPSGFDLIVEYNDTWRWDFKKILDKLEIVFISPEGDKAIAKSTYTIYKNKELHNFPTPEKEVPKMIKELLKK